MLSVALYEIIALVFEIGVLGYSVSSQGTYIVILFGVVFIFVCTESMNYRARRKARQIVADDEIEYQKRWQKLCAVSNNQLELLETKLQTFGHVFESGSSIEVLQDCEDIDVLYAHAEFINAAFQSLVSLLVEEHENPKQRASSIQELILLSPNDDNHHIMDRFSQPNESVIKSSKGTEEHVAVDISACARNSQTAHESETSSTMLPPPPPQLMLNLPTIHHQVTQETSTLPNSIELDSLPANTTGSYAHANTPAAPSTRRGPVKLPSRAIAKVRTQCCE